MIQILDQDVDQLELFLRRIVSTVAHRETRDQANLLLQRIRLARRAYVEPSTANTNAHAESAIKVEAEGSD